MKVEVFNIINGINKSRTLAKHILSGCRCGFDGRKFNLRQKWNNDKCQWECKKTIRHRAHEENYA